MAAGPFLGHLPRAKLAAAAIAIVVAATCQASIANGTSQPTTSLDAFSTIRVRGLDHRAAILLADGRRQSATFRRLCDTLEQGDVIVLVKTGTNLRTPAQTMFLGAKPGSARFVLVTLAVPDMNDVLIAWLGHELQHAVEIAAAPDVVNEQTMSAFFCRIGQRIPGRGFCTFQAQRVRDAVAYELSEK